MLALVKTAAGPGLTLQERPGAGPGHQRRDDPRPRRPASAAPTSTSTRGTPWAAKTIRPPLIVGHEFVGEVVEVGSNVYDFHPGDVVSGEGHVTCGLCRHCLAGRRHLCAHPEGLGVDRDGAFAEYVVLPMANVWHHWPGHRRGRRGDLRPVRERGPHGARRSRSWARTC